MNKENDILIRLKNKDYKGIYEIPENYFNGLNNQLNNKITNLELKKTKIIFLSPLLKVAAVLLIIVGFYFIFLNPTNELNINYVQLNNSLDEYLANDNDLYYTFTNNEKDYNYLNINENIDDYFETETYFY